MNSEPLTPLNSLSKGNTEGESNSVSQSDSPKATNEYVSLLSPNNSSHNPHNKRPLSSAKNIHPEEREKKATGLGSDLVALKMERLRKKKEEIELVKCFWNYFLLCISCFMLKHR